MNRRGLCCYELVEPLRAKARTHGAAHVAGMVALQLAIVLGCLGGALWLGGRR